mgnify:FL=1
MQEDRIPKVFISYSWSSDTMAVDLAKRLVSHGVDVVIDKWNLKEGQDKYVFMERCVNDPDITKVLIICDKKYSEKANARIGGVGDETAIISAEVYGNVQQEKFIPVIAEKDESGKPYVPTYIKNRIYVDLAEEEQFEAEYEKLLRNIYEKPLYRKPRLGKKPEWLDEEKTDLFPLKDIIKQIKGSCTDNRRRACIIKFQTLYIEAMKAFWVENVTCEKEFELFMETKPLRDLFLDFAETVAEVEDDYAVLLAEIFERLYNALTNVKTFDPTKIVGYEEDIDLYKIHIWELFICVVAYMRHIEDYKGLNILISYTYYLNRRVLGETQQATNYTSFRHHSGMIEYDYKNIIGQTNKFTLLGDVICNQREKLPIYSKNAIADADLFLYQIRNGLDLAYTEYSVRSGGYWFPNLYIYAPGNTLNWSKMSSKRFCEKMLILFGVDSIEELKNVISNCVYDQDMKYNGSFDAAPVILNYIKVEDIGIYN